MQSNGNASLIRVLKVVTSTSPHAIGIKSKRSGGALWLSVPTAENGKSIYGAILFPARPLAANAHITDAEGERLEGGGFKDILRA